MAWGDNVRTTFIWCIHHTNIRKRGVQRFFNGVAGEGKLYYRKIQNISIYLIEFFEEFCIMEK